MIILKYCLCILIGYLLGTSNMAYFIGKLHKMDLKKEGTGNLGASNAVITMGLKAGVLVLLHDAAKAILAVFLCVRLFGVPYGGLLAGAASILGHIFPFYLHFKGGKGFASYIGLTLALDWRFGLCMLVLIVVVSLIFDWIVAGTLSTATIAPIYFYFTISSIAFLILLPISICIYCKHIENFRRKKLGQESGVRAAVFKKR